MFEILATAYINFFQDLFISNRLSTSKMISLHNKGSTICEVWNSINACNVEKFVVPPSKANTHFDSIKSFWTILNCCKLFLNQSDLLRGIDKKTVRREGVLICFLIFTSQKLTFYKETKWFGISVFFIYSIFQKLFSEWKPYVANIACNFFSKLK